MSNGDPVVTGAESLTPANQPAPKGRRIASNINDLVLVPVLLGVAIGLMIIPIPTEWIRTTILISVNVLWLLFRDLVFSPGRKMVGLVVVGEEGQKITFAQAFIRNILIMIPFVLVVGYPVELIFVLTKGCRLSDKWARTKVVVV